jgi:hypothetical protein
MLVLLWENKRIIGEILGLILLCFVAWWFFIHNPKVIDGLEKDKIELSRQVQEGLKAAALLQTIEKGKAGIDRETFKNISTIRAAIIPRRAVLIRGGVPLQALH